MWRCTTAPRYLRLNRSVSRMPLSCPLIVTSSQIPGKLLNGSLSEFLGRKPTYALFALVASVGAYFFGQSSEPIMMMGWGCLFLFAASGSAPSYKMWYAEQYPTPIRAIGLSTCEGIGRRRRVDSSLSGAGRRVWGRHHDDA